MPPARGAGRVERAAAVERAVNDRHSRAVDRQTVDDRMHVAADGQPFSAGDVPSLRSANRDGRVDRDVFIGVDAAGGDGQTRRC